MPTSFVVDNCNIFQKSGQRTEAFIYVSTIFPSKALALGIFWS